MKKIVLIVSMFLMGQSIFAQDMNAAAERATARATKMTTELALTAEQQVKVQNLLNGIEMKLEAARNEPSFTAEQRAEQIKMNKEAELYMLGTILTDSQMQKHKELAKRDAAKQEAQPNK